MSNIERRDSTLDRSQIHVRSVGDSPKIEGYAAVFDAPTVIWDFEEVVARGAFKRPLSEKQNIRSLFNHDSNYILGTTRNNTLIAREDDHGLWTETDPPKSPIADSIVESVRRGDVSGMSFAFTVRKQEWQFQEAGSDKLDRRIITEIGQIYDIGPVTFPAYEQTSVTVREAAKAFHAEARSRWETRKISIQVPRGIELVFTECRSGDLWVSELKRTDEAKADAKIDEKIEPEAAPVEAEKEPEAESKIPEATTGLVPEKSGDEPGEVHEAPEAASASRDREIALKRKVRAIPAR